MIGQTLRNILALGIWILTAACGAAQEPKAELGQSYQCDFTKLTQKPPEWAYYGPNADKLVKIESEGVRITLLTGKDGAWPETGLATRTTLKGDFEVTARYEVLAEPAVTEIGNNYTRFTLSVLFASSAGAATLSRRMQSKAGTQFLGWMNQREEAEGKSAPKSFIAPTTATKGRLRIARTGDKLVYRAADDDAMEFRLLGSLRCNRDDIVEVRLVGTIQGPKADLDVRVTDLQIRADDIAQAPTAPPPAPVVKLVAPTKQYAQEYFQSFKASAAKPAGWEFVGPDIETSLAFDAEGAHFTLPAGWKGLRAPSGLKSTFGFTGDFEITLNFAVLVEPAQADAGFPVGTRLSIGLFKEAVHVDVTTLSWMKTSKSGRMFIGWASMWNEDARKLIQHTGNGKTTKAKIGRLRLVRSGNDLYYGASESLDGDFHFFKKYPFGSEDLREMRITAGTGGEKAALDVRVTDLRIRADAIPNMPASSPVQAGGIAVHPEQAAGKGSLAIVLGGALAATLLAALALGGFLLLRRRNASVPSSAPPAFLSCACPTCDKQFKVKAELAGKKVKCSQCGNAVRVSGEA